MPERGTASSRQIHVAADTAYGVLFANLVGKRGGLIVTDSLVEKLAEQHDIPVSDVYELILVRVDGKRTNLPHPPHHPACGKDPLADFQDRVTSWRDKAVAE